MTLTCKLPTLNKELIIIINSNISWPGFRITLTSALFTLVLPKLTHYQGQPTTLEKKRKN